MLHTGLKFRNDISTQTRTACPRTKGGCRSREQLRQRGANTRCPAAASSPDGTNEEPPHMQLPGPGVSPDFRHYQTTIPSSSPRIASPTNLSHIDHDASYITTRCHCPSAPIPTPPPSQNLADLSTYLTFNQLMQQPDDAIDPLQCALLIALAADRFPISEYQRIINEMGDMVALQIDRAKISGVDVTDGDKLAAINYVLYEVNGFNSLIPRADATGPSANSGTAGSSPSSSSSGWGRPPAASDTRWGRFPAAPMSDLYHPSMHYINQVVDSHQGSPTAMAILYLALGERVGLKLLPVLLRSHVYLAAGGRQDCHVVDPYHHGKLCTRADVAAALAQNKVYVAGHVEGETSGGPTATPWPVADRKDLVLRLLLNLREVYWGPILRCQYGGSDAVQKLWQLQRGLQIMRFARVVAGEHPGLLCDEGMALVLLGRTVEGLPLLSRYLHRCPDSADATMVRRLLVHFSKGGKGPPLDS